MNAMFYLLLAFTAVLAATANAGRQILDYDGVPVFNSSYYLIPRYYGTGGGLTLSPRGDNQCPLYIGQDSMGEGIPVIISHWLSHVDYIYESVGLNIKMDVEATTCAQSTYWSVPAPDIITKPVFIVAGTIPSNGSFQIKKLETGISGYKIVFCPTGKDCTNVGIFVDEAGVRRLVFSFASFLRPFIRPFEFVLVKATETETSSKTMSII